MTELKTRTVPIKDLTPDPANVRTHDDKNLDAIKRSLSSFGQRKPIVCAKANDGSLVVIAGNGTLEAAKALGWDKITIAQVPDDWDADKARAYAIADNRTAELADWNQVALSNALIELDAVGWDLKDLGFESVNPAEGSPSEGDAYTSAINVPQYEIVGERPAVSELFDQTRTKQLQAQIKAAKIDPEIADFLNLAAQRHTIINYRKVAEFYPHAPAEVQQLIEESALIIVDMNNAIRNGYANFMDRIDSLEEQDRYES